MTIDDLQWLPMNTNNYQWLLFLDHGEPSSMTLSLNIKCFIRADHLLRALRQLLADSSLRVGRGKTFWRVGHVLFYENGHNSGTKGQKIYQMWKMNRLSEVYKRAVDQNWGCMAKIRISGPKKHILLSGHHVLAATGKSSAKKKVPFSKIDISLLRNVVVFLG